MDNQTKAARVATVIIFLALIRCISEPFRLQHYSSVPFTFDGAKPFLLGALVAAVGLFIMTLCSFWKLHKVVIATGILALIGLFVVKYLYLS